MNTKILIQTLTEIPDLSLLSQLQSNLKTVGTVNVPDLKKLFIMFNSLLKHPDKKITMKSLLILISIARTLLQTEVQLLWRAVGENIIRLGGIQDIQVRKKSKEILMEFLQLGKNALMILQKLYEFGIQGESSLVTTTSISSVLSIFQANPNLLQKKSNIPIVKLIIERMTQLTTKQNVHVSSSVSDFLSKARQFLKSLFYLNFANMHEVLQRMQSIYLLMLQKIWEKDKEKLIYKSQDNEQLKSIQYQHLPILKEKIFGVYQPFIIKNLFSFETKAANKYSVQQFHKLFIENQDYLIKYVNMITKIIVKIIPQEHTQILQLLLHILQLPGISNIINLSPLLQEIIPQLAHNSVPYRKLVRECLQRLNSTAKNVLQKYNKTLNEIDRSSQDYDWIMICELIDLVKHWMQVSQPTDCYPPAFNDALIFAFNKRSHKITKVKQKCSDFLFDLLEKYPAYRETLEDVLSPKEMGELQDQIQSKKNYKNLIGMQNKQAKETFIKEYHEQRSRYIKKIKY